MVSRLADVLCRRAATLADPAARVQHFRSLIALADPDAVAHAHASLVERAGLRDTHAQIALLALQAALGVHPSPGSTVPSACDPSVGVNPTGDGTDPAHRVPDYGRGRTLTLGERKSLVRQPDRRTLERALRDPHPDVIRSLLQNPRITEIDVLRICSFRPGVPDVLARVFDNPRWAANPRVRRALAFNPSTPSELTGSLVPLLSTTDLRTLAGDDRYDLSVRRRCLEVLARLTPTPATPPGSSH